MFEFITDEELRNKAVSEYEQATSGLKIKNDELLNEKKTIQERLKTFDGIDDAAAAQEALKFVRENEQARLIQEGKFEELIEKRVSQVKSDAMAKIEELTTKYTTAAQEGLTYKQKFNQKMIEDDLRSAAIAAGVRPEALSDVLLRGAIEFTLSEDGKSVEARDEKGNLRKNSDGIVLIPSVWIEGLKKTAPHYWPGSESAGFTGANASPSDLMARMQELLDKGDMVGYRRLRDQAKGKK